MEFMATVEEFWSGNYDIKRLNRSFLVLLDKCQGTVRMGEFWPILLSNTVYLTIVEVLAISLREVMRELVVPLWSAFIPGTQLVDGAFVVGESRVGKRMGIL